MSVSAVSPPAAVDPTDPTDPTQSYAQNADGLPLMFDDVYGVHAKLEPSEFPDPPGQGPGEKLTGPVL